MHYLPKNLGRRLAGPSQTLCGGAARYGGFCRTAGLAGAAGLIYLLIAGSFRFQFHQTDYAHHIIMADAMLHGQLHVRPEILRRKAVSIAAQLAKEIDARSEAFGWQLEPGLRAELIKQGMADKLVADWAVVGDRVYGYWAPLAPAMMVPFVAVFGAEVSDRLINALFGALNVGLFYWFLRRVDRAGLCRTSEACRIGLTLTLAFGTVHFWLVCTAQVWFAVHVVTLTAMLGALLAACGPTVSTPRWMLAGVFFGAALLGRNIVILGLPFFIALMLIRLGQSSPRRAAVLIRWLAAFSVPVLAAVAVQGVYNHARFGSALDSGLGHQVTTGGLSRFLEAYEQYGVFSLHHVPHNLWYYFVNWELPRLGDGRIWFDTEGNSLFLVTPPMLYVLLAWRRRSAFTLALLAGVLPLVAALMLYFATGYVQFGPRYLSDVLPLLLLLAAAGMRGRLTPLAYVLIVLAIAANLFGAYRLCDQQFALLHERVSYTTLPALVGIALLAGLLFWRRRRGPSAT